MNRIPGRGWRAVAAAALVFAILLFGTPTPSAAATYTFHFAGAAVVGSPDDDTIFHALGIVAGDPVSGTMTLDPFITDPTTVNASSSVFEQPSVSYTFHFGHPGKPARTFTGSGTGTVGFGGGPLGFKDFAIRTTSHLVVFFQTDAQGPALLSLENLPTTPGGILSLLGGNAVDVFGALDFKAGRLYFSLNATPIPAALPLFVSALGGLAFIGWRRKRAHGAS